MVRQFKIMIYLNYENKLVMLCKNQFYLINLLKKIFFLEINQLQMQKSGNVQIWQMPFNLLNQIMRN